MKIEITDENLKIMNSEEYKYYLKSLCKLASKYISRIRVQFAEKSFEMYANETVRKVVIAYGHEYDQLVEDRFRDFKHVAEQGSATADCLNDSCLNNAEAYGKTIKLLFDIR